MRCNQSQDSTAKPIGDKCTQQALGPTPGLNSSSPSPTRRNYSTALAVWEFDTLDASIITPVAKYCVVGWLLLFGHFSHDIYKYQLQQPFQLFQLYFGVGVLMKFRPH